MDEQSIKESLILRARKQRFWRLYKAGQLPFHRTGDQCSSCESYVDPNSEGGRWRAIELIDVEGQVLCRDCFLAEWTPEPSHRPAGNHHPAVPSSERQYHGGGQL